jgi:hypothetical protein
MNIEDVRNLILKYYINNITTYTNIDNILVVRIVNKNFNKKINYAIMNYLELLFQLNINQSYLKFYIRYINMYILLCINSKFYNAYQSKIMIYNLMYIFRSRYKITSILNQENKDYKIIIFNNINFNLMYNHCNNIKLYFTNINKFKNFIKISLKI